MENTKPFSLAAVLSVTTGRLLCDMGDLYQILGYMTGEDLMTHQLPRAFKPCRAALLEQFTFLQSAHMEEAEEALTETLGAIKAVPAVPPEAAIAIWLEGLQAQKYGIKFPATFDVAPLGASAYAAMDPIQELREMTDAEIIVVSA